MTESSWDLCRHCGNSVVPIGQQWAHVSNYPHGVDFHVWCHTTKAFPEDAA